jgi:hypothetical protein
MIMNYAAKQTVATDVEVSSETEGIAYAFIREKKVGQRIVCVKLFESGYYPSPVPDNAPSEEEARNSVALLNLLIGVPNEIADSMLSGSMFGWHVPGAVKAIDFFAKRRAIKTVVTARAVTSAEVADRMMNSMLNSSSRRKTSRVGNTAR